MNHITQGPASGGASRVIGVRHRVKATADGEARPTELVIHSVEAEYTLELKTEQDELDFIRGHYPVRHRKVTAEDDLSQFRPHQVIWRSTEEGEDLTEIPEAHKRMRDKKLQIAAKVPAEFDGLRQGDQVAMVLGGSGDSLAYGLTNVGQKIGAKVFRIPAFLLKSERGEAKKDEDAGLLARLLTEKQHLFYEVRPRDQALIQVIELYRARMEAMQARIACEQRLRTNFIGKMLRNPGGPYPEGAIEDLFNEEKTTNTILQSLEKEEATRERDLTKALEKLDVYTEVFQDVEGCGMSVSARIIAAVQDIRRFGTKHKFKAFLGAHVFTKWVDGQPVNPERGAFPRTRRGQTSNWNRDGRQGLYLFGDQMSRRKTSVWGLKYREYKVKLREKHPEVLVVDGKKRYTDGHIHKMALQRTMTKFAEWLYNEWWKLEERAASPEPSQEDEAQAA